MELVLKHLRSSTMVTTQLHIALAWCQRHAGISNPLLEFPATPLPPLETSFLPNLRTYLASTKSALNLENSHVTPSQRTGDFHLLDRVLQSNQLTSRQIRQIKSSKYTPSLTWLQLSELILTSPFSVVNPVYSPANQHNIKSGKNVRTAPPHGQCGGSLVPCGAIPSRENYINH
jgi:hypothetical protein